MLGKNEKGNPRRVRNRRGFFALERFWNAFGAGTEPGERKIRGVSGKVRRFDLEVTIMYFEAIAKIIAERTGCDVSAVKPESTFTELGIDSLDTVELLMNLEDELGIEIELEQPVATVDDLDKFIQSKQG